MFCYRTIGGVIGTVKSADCNNRTPCVLRNECSLRRLKQECGHRSCSTLRVVQKIDSPPFLMQMCRALAHIEPSGMTRVPPGREHERVRTDTQGVDRPRCSVLRRFDPIGQGGLPFPAPPAEQHEDGAEDRPSRLRHDFD
jgi:hypothetical protein